KVVSRIHRRAVHPYFKVQQFGAATIVADLADFVAGADACALTDKHIAVMGVSGQVSCTVTDDDQVALPLDATTGVHHIAVSGGVDGIAALATDIDAATDAGGVSAVGTQHLTIDRPLPADVIDHPHRHVDHAPALHGLGRAAAGQHLGVTGRRGGNRGHAVQRVVGHPTYVEAELLVRIDGIGRGQVVGHGQRPVVQ